MKSAFLLNFKGLPASPDPCSAAMFCFLKRPVPISFASEFETGNAYALIGDTNYSFAFTDLSRQKSDLLMRVILFQSFD